MALMTSRKRQRQDTLVHKVKSRDLPHWGGLAPCPASLECHLAQGVSARVLPEWQGASTFAAIAKNADQVHGSKLPGRPGTFTDGSGTFTGLF